MRKLRKVMAPLGWPIMTALWLFVQCGTVQEKTRHQRRRQIQSLTNKHCQLASLTTLWLIVVCWLAFSFFSQWFHKKDKISPQFWQPEFKVIGMQH
uniref:Uncharacterized protein n=1 Tax=Rhipicephalus zambeziensis TaxID=60191 RepID=A0A224YGJ8_9ACAR